MFYKINPRLERVTFDLAPEGFLKGDRLWIDVKGAFKAGDTVGPITEDKWQNAAFQFQVGAEFTKEFDDPNSLPVLAKARSTLLVVNNYDDPLSDNSDPNKDYGVRVKLAAFTAENDTFYFKGRNVLPEVQGSIYSAGAGNDVVVMPDAPVQGFDPSKAFYAGPGNDRVVAGAFDHDIRFGTGVDTFVLKGAAIDWSNRENRDNDGTLVVTGGGHTHTVVDAELLKSGNKLDVLSKWYFDFARGADGNLAVKFFENGKQVAFGAGFYDEALPVPAGVYEARFLKGGWMGERIELTGVGGEFGDVTVRKATSGATAEGELLVTPGFLAQVFAHIEDAYDLAGRAVPWKGGVLDPLVPVTGAVRGAVTQPVIAVKNLVTSDAGSDKEVSPKFTLQGGPLEDRSVEIFFKVGGKATLNTDWSFAEGTRLYTGDDFADGVLRQGRDASGAMIYSVMLEDGERSVAVPIKILRDSLNEGNEKISVSIVDVDIWREVGDSDKLYRVSGGPNNDRESDFDGPNGAEHALIKDGYFTITINDHIL